MHRARCLQTLAAAVAAVLGGSPAMGATSASWLSPADGSWTDAANWSTKPAYPNNAQPNPADLYSVTIGAAGSAYTVTLNSDISISSLLLNSADAQLLQQFGTLRLVDGGGTISAGDYVLNNGTLASDDPITIGSQMHWFDGTLAGLGSLDITPAGSLNLGNGGSRTLSKQINNSGILNLSGGALSLSNGTINNQSAGVFNLTGSPNLFTGAGTSDLVRNSGLMNVLTAVNWTAPLLNSSRINATGGTLTFGNGTFTEEAGAAFIGSGTIDLSSGTHNINGTLTIAGNNVRLSGGTLNGAGAIDITGKLTYNGGTINGTGLITVKPNASMDIGTLNVTRVIARPLNNLGTINYVSGAATLNSVLTNTSGGVLNYTATNGNGFSVGSLGLLR